MQFPPVRSLWTPLLLAGAMVMALLSATSAWAIEYRLAPVADTTVFTDIGGGTASQSLSDGGPNLWLSTTMGGQARRALLRFDVSAIPAGAQITSARLVLYEIRARADNVVSVHRLLSSWGEATADAGDSGSGVPANNGDATWLHRFYPTVSWGQAGGDFAPQASTALFVGPSGEAYTWPSTAQMVADVQGWLQAPASNHGWIMIGDEVNSGSAKRMASRESSVDVLRPLLIVQADPPVVTGSDGDVPLPAWALALLGGSLLGLMSRRG